MSQYDRIEKQGKPKYLGGGSYGSVYLVKRRSDRKDFAQKEIRMADSDRKQRKHVETEFRIQSQLQHVNIAKYIDEEGLNNPSGDIFFYMDYFKSGSLKALIKKRRSRPEDLQAAPPITAQGAMLLDEDLVWCIMYQLSSALVYLSEEWKRSIHSQSGEQIDYILHRDIKPDNVLLSGDWTPLLERDNTSTFPLRLDSVKLADFGLGILVDKAKLVTTYAGTPAYLAPEIKRGETQWGPEADLFSLGCTLWELCNLEPPYNDHLKSESVDVDSMRDKFTQKLRDCIGKRIKRKPTERGSASEMRQCSENELKNTYSHGGLFFERDLMAAVNNQDTSEVQRLCSKSQEKSITITDGMYGQSLLHKAAENGNQKIVALLLQAGADAGVKDRRGETPLHAVASTDHIDIAQKLLGQARNFRKCDKRGWMPLHTAVASNQKRMVELLLEFDKDINSQTQGKRWSPLHIAAWSNSMSMLKFLLQKKASVDSKNKNHKTPLYSACKYGQLETAQALLDHGANANAASDKTGMTPLHVAVKYGRHNVIERLQNHKDTKFSLLTKNKETALHLAAQSKKVKTPEIISSLVSKGLKLDASVEKKGLGSCTALHLAVEADNYDGLKMLLELLKRDEKTLEATTGNSDKDETVLHLAARKGIPDIIKLLLDKGSNPKAVSRQKKIPLHRAVESGNEKAVIAMVQHKKHPPALIFQPDAKGYTALHLAAETGSVDIITELCQQAEKSRADLPEKIRKLPSVVDVPNHNRNEQTPLDLAKEKNKTNVVRCLTDIKKRCS